MNTPNLYGKIYRDGTVVMYSGRGGTADRVKIARENTGNSRKFRVNKAKLRSATLALWKGRKHRTMLFLTVTLEDGFKYVSERKVARAWRNWIKNLEQNRGVKGYAWVKELQKNGKIHYHILLDARYVNISKAQMAWETALYHVSNIQHLNHCSVRLGTRPVVNSPHRVARYLSKYVSKSTDEFTQKAYGHSAQTISWSVDATDLDHWLYKVGVTAFVTEPYLFVGRVDLNQVDGFVARYALPP